jgi:hypothetical protein
MRSGKGTWNIQKGEGQCKERQVRRHRFLNRGSLDQVIWDWTPSPTVFVRRVQALGTGACRLCDGATVTSLRLHKGSDGVYRYVCTRCLCCRDGGGASCVRHDSKRAGE